MFRAATQEEETLLNNASKKSQNMQPLSFLLFGQERPTAEFQTLLLNVPKDMHASNFSLF